MTKSEICPFWLTCNAWCILVLYEFNFLLYLESLEHVVRADIDYDLPNAGKYFRSVMEGFEHNDYETVMCNIFLVFTLTYCWWIMLHFGHSTFCRLLKRFWRTMFLCTWKTTTINLIYWCEFKFEFIILLFFGKSFIFVTSIFAFLLHLLL